MEKYNHIIDRNIVKWTSFGKFHDEKPRTTLVKDISDSHLLHIIIWIKEYNTHYSNSILELMILESEYRVKNYIFVPDYDDVEKYKK